MKSQRSKVRTIHRSHINGTIRGYKRADLLLDRIVPKEQYEFEVRRGRIKI